MHRCYSQFQLDNLTRKHKKDCINQALCGNEMGRGLRKNGGEKLGCILKMEMVSTVTHTYSIFDNVFLPPVSTILASDVPSFMSFG